jgi:hypothetical protein
MNASQKGVFTHMFSNYRLHWVAVSVAIGMMLLRVLSGLKEE